MGFVIWFMLTVYWLLIIVFLLKWFTTTKKKTTKITGFFVWNIRLKLITKFVPVGG